MAVKKKPSSDYKPEYCQKLLDLAKEGKSLTQSAAAMGIYRQRIYEWAQVHPDLADALEKAGGLCEAWWENVGQNGLFDKDLNDRLWYRFMANRFGWRDNKNVVAKVELSPLDQLKALE